MQCSTKDNILQTLYKMKNMGFYYINDISFISNENNFTDLPSDYASLNDIILNCNLCTLSNKNHKILVGDGNIDANIVFLNTAPNQLEDISGGLLSGNYGNIIKKICNNILNISVDSVYILNILKCIPQKDLKNCSVEINTCKPYVKKQLDIINPKLIIAFGDSFSYLDGNFKDLSKIRGTIQMYNNIKVISTYDPIHILRNPSLKQDVFEDLTKAKLIMEQF